MIEQVEQVEGSSSVAQHEMRAPDAKWTRNGAVTLSNAPLKERHVFSGSNQVRYVDRHDQLLPQAPSQERKVGSADVVDRGYKPRVVDPPPCLLLRTSSVIHVNPPKKWILYRMGVGPQVNEWQAEGRPRPGRRCLRHRAEVASSPHLVLQTALIRSQQIVGDCEERTA